MSAELTFDVDLDGYFNKVIERSQSKIQEAVYSAIAELFEELKVDLQDVYKNTIDQFYSDYTPRSQEEGGYVRHHSLYDLIQFTDNKGKNAEDYELRWDFDPREASGFERSYGSVFDLAFIQGWHGGASGVDSYGNRPDSATPHWRYPYPYYTKWGREAEQMIPSPYDTWEKSRTEYIQDNARNRFISLLQEHINKIKWF